MSDEQRRELAEQIVNAAPQLVFDSPDLLEVALEPTRATQPPPQVVFNPGHHI